MGLADKLICRYGSAAVPVLFCILADFVWCVQKEKNGDEAFSRYNYFSADRLRIFAVESSFNSSFGLWLALLFVLVSFGLIGGYQNRQHGKADFSKVARISWRISFLCFTVLYAALLIWNIGKSLLAGSVS